MATTQTVMAARMSAARAFTSDGGFNISIASLDSELRLQKSTSKGFVFDFDGGKFRLMDDDEFDDIDTASEADDDLDPDPDFGNAEIEDVPDWEKELLSGDEVKVV